MRTRHPGLLLVAILALVTLAAPASGQSRPTVAALDFEFGAIQQWWGGNWDIGRGIADLIVDGLVEDGSYRVIERKRLDLFLAEQNFSNSDRADPEAADVAKIGKALGVKCLIVGTITKFGMETKDTKLGGGAWGAGRFGLGELGKKKGKAQVAITARMIDTTTGEILASAKGEGTSSRSGLLVGGSANHVVGNVEFGSSDFQETVLGEATEEAVKQVVAKLVAAKGRIGS